MDETSNIAFPQLKRVAQITDSHCGPAVLEMLLSHLGVTITQEQVVEVTDVGPRLAVHGMNIQELALAVYKLAPQYLFWYKSMSTSADLDRIINFYNQPVGVEWQGVFEQYADEDDGHYGVVTKIDIPQNAVYIADPFEVYAGTDRKFLLNEFEDRWWDVNEIVNPQTGQVTHEADDQMMFVITQSAETFPATLNMTNATLAIQS